MLTQNEDAVLEALLTMYRATSATEYLDAFTRHADAVLTQRDDADGGQAIFSNRAYSQCADGGRPFFSNGLRACPSTEGRPYAYPIESGQIMAPFADFARLVLGNPSLESHVRPSGPSFRTLALRYRAAALATWQVHFADFSVHTQGVPTSSWGVVPAPLGWFVTAPGIDFRPNDLVGGTPVPVNMTVSLGRVAALLSAAYRGDDPQASTSLAASARHIAAFAKVELVQEPSDFALVWRYWPQMPYVTSPSYFHPGTRPGSSWEDMAHATVLTAFFAQAESADVDRDAGVVTRGLVAGLTRTLRHRLLRGGTPRYTVEPTGQVGDAGVNLPVLGLYLDLLPYDTTLAPGLYADVHRILVDEVALTQSIQSASGLLSLAKLIEHRQFR